MSIETQKIRIVQQILNIDLESELNEIEGLLSGKGYQLNESDIKVLDKRRKRHLEGKSKSYSWAEVKLKARSLNEV